MKLYGTLGLAAFFVLSQFTLAAPSVPPKALGQAESTIDFCVRVDSKSADKYTALGKAVVAGMSEKELAETRNSSDYKETYSAITGQLEKTPADKAVEGCRASLGDAGK
jgi:hypothetical protein